MHHSSLAFYQAFSRLLPVSYAGKLLGVVFAAACAPLLGVLAYVYATNPVEREWWGMLAIAAIALLAGGALGAYGIHRLLAPIALATLALREYVDARRIPELPPAYDDVAGGLMSEVQRAVELIENRQRTLKTSAMQDFLTGALNRRAGAERLHSDTARAARDGGGYSLAFIDLDNLKQINDRHGHHFGDLCLQRLVGTVRAGMRQGDWLARWGGDEFVLLLWDVDLGAAAEVLLRLSAAFTGKPLPTEAGEPVHLHMSAGVCQHQPGWQGDTVLRHADAALYEAKHNGKSGVVTTDGSRHTRWPPTVSASIA